MSSGYQYWTTFVPMLCAVTRKSKEGVHKMIKGSDGIQISVSAHTATSKVPLIQIKTPQIALSVPHGAIWRNKRLCVTKTCWRILCCHAKITRFETTDLRMEIMVRRA